MVAAGCLGCCSSSSSSSSSGPCTCGCPGGLPDTLHLSGPCSAVLTWDGVRWAGSASCSFGCGTPHLYFCFSCVGVTCTCADYSLTVSCAPCDQIGTTLGCLDGPPPSCSCTPFEYVFNCASGTIACCGPLGDLAITITE